MLHEAPLGRVTAHGGGRTPQLQATVLPEKRLRLWRRHSSVFGAAGALAFVLQLARLSSVCGYLRHPLLAKPRTGAERES